VSAFYDQTGEYVAVLLAALWEGLGPALTAALDGLEPTAGPIVDVGAGNGFGTRVIAAAVPHAEIIAVEPDRALRTALLAMVGADVDLRTRVTVLDTDLLRAELPPRIGGLVAMNVIGHFSPVERARVWVLLAERLVPQGRAVLNLYPPYRPEAVPNAPMGEATIGRRRYTASAAAQPAGEDAVTWEMTYRVEQDGRAVATFSARDHWYVLSPDQLAAELAPHDLRLTPGDPTQGMHMITHD